MTKRVPKSNIVSGSKRVLPAGHPDLIWYDPSEVIVIGEDSEYRVSGTGIPRSGSSVGGPLDPEAPEKEKDAEENAGSEETIDVPQLSDIESITPEEYKNGEGVTKIRLRIKIRNSSKNKNNVGGVDARLAPTGE